MGIQSQLLPLVSTFFLSQVYSFQTPGTSPNSNIPKQTASLNLSMQTEKDVKPLHFLYFPTKEWVTCLFSRMLPNPFPLNT